MDKKNEQSDAERQQAMRALQAEIYAQELRKLEQEYQQLMMRISDVENTIKALDILSSKGKFSALSPVGSGVYVRAGIESTDEVLVSITSKYAIKMKRDDARRFLQEMKTRLEQAASEVEREFSVIDSQLQQMIAESSK